SFIHYLDQLRETGEGLEEAKLIGESENLVRIMSIHKSKGLEFGVVFLCDTAKRFNHKDMAKSVLLHHELGLAPEFIDIESHVKYPTIPKMAVKSQILRENISEEMRVLYVALTRAKEKLFITGAISDFSKKASEWSLFGARSQQGIVPLGIRRAGSYLNWIGMGLYAHSEFKAIRDEAQIHSEFSFEGESKWQLQLWDKALLSTQAESSKIQQAANEEILNQWNSEKHYGDYKEEIYRRLDFKYAYEEAVMLPTKLSVSEIKKHTVELQEQKKIPIFINGEEPIRGAQRGTLIHSIFEHVDFLRYTKEEEIREAIESLIAQQKLQKEALQVVDVKRLAQFASSDRIIRMRKAKHVWKEKQFVYLEEAKLIDDSYPSDEKILIQGMIDTFFIEEDGIVIIDYKTDFIDPKNRDASITALKERYKLQLDLYGRAISEMTQKPIKEKCIYLYQIDQWITL
ncbi:MAG: addA, partial [Clostridia bacterium]|nr:addA [Clostridia bacterium]